MEAMHHPIVIKKVHHSLTCDATEVEMTKFVEYINRTWYKEFHTLFQFENVRWDNGHDVLRFDTTSGKVNIVKCFAQFLYIFHNIYFDFG